MNNRALMLLAMLPLLAGCDSLPAWMGGGEKEVERLPGERIAALPVDSEMQPDAAIKAMPVSLPAAILNPDWAQHTGAVHSANSNLAGGRFESISQATAGDGNGFEHTLIPAPVVGGGLVFAMDAIGRISAHEAGNIASIRWSSDGVSEEDEPQIIGGGLAYDQGVLYVTSGRGIVAAFDAPTGKPLWSKSLRLPFRSPPRVAGGRLFAITIDSQIYALSASDGSVLWSQRGISETTGLMNSVAPAVAGDTVIVPYASGEIYALSASDGRELWTSSLAPGKRTQASAFLSGIGGNPVVDGAVVFAVSGGGMVSTMAVATGQHAWNRATGSLNTPWPSGDFLFMLSDDNTLLCMLKYNGRIRWATKLASYEDEGKKKGAIVWKGPVMADGRLVLVSASGQLALVSAADGTLLATRDIPEGIYTPPVIAGGRLYLIDKEAQLYELK